MKRLIDQLDELEQQLLAAQNRLIQLSLFGGNSVFSKSKITKELRTSVNFFMQSSNPIAKKVGNRYQELYLRKKKKLEKIHQFLVDRDSSFAKLSKVFYRNQDFLKIGEVS